MNSEKLQYIIDCLPIEELLCQLAEEAAELGHAALKLRRSIDGSNPTPVTEQKGMDNLFEEISDVCLVLNLLGFPVDINDKGCMDIMARKADRWADRLDWGSER